MPNISLLCLSGPLTGQIFRLSGGPLFIFGRYPRANCSLAADPSASHLHFAIDVSDSRVRIIDLGSTNGLVVNDRHYGGKTGTPVVDFVALKNGDIIMAGSCVFRLNQETPRTSRATTQAEERKKSAIIPNLYRPATQHARRPAPAYHDTVSTDTVLSPPVSAPPGEETTVDGAEKDAPFPEIVGFTIVEKIGGGGKGVVYKAVKNDTGAAAAIKLLLSHKGHRLRSIEVFRREILVTRQLSHPNIIRYLGDGLAGGDPYLALEFIAGGTVDELISSSPGGRMDLPEAVPLFIQILEATAYMHSLFLVHRDIKPKNILLDVRRGGSMAAKLSDMGLACRVTSHDMDELFPIVSEGGTPAYMAPEQLLDITRAMPQSDVFSLAAPVYHMLTGTLLYDFAGRDQREAIIEGNIKPILYLRPDLPPGLANAISKGLSYNPENRYENAQEMLDAIKQALD